MDEFRPVVVHDPALRRGRPSVDDLTMHLRLLYLLPYTTHVDHAAERAAYERRTSRERAARLASIPAQRAPSEPRRAPGGSPTRPNTAWGTRSARR